MGGKVPSTRALICFSTVGGCLVLLVLTSLILSVLLTVGLRSDGGECWELLFSGFLLRFSPSPLIQWTPIRVNKVLRYVVKKLGCVVHLIVPVSSHHTPEAEIGSNVPDNPIDNVSVVVLSVIFALFLVRAELFFTGMLFPVGRLIVAMVR